MSRAKAEPVLGHAAVLYLCDVPLDDSTNGGVELIVQISQPCVT